MPAAQTYVIVGASLAGAKAAETLRDEGFDGAIVLIGAETDRPYERPPLSKDVLLGSKTADSAFVHDAGWYAEHDVDLRLGTRVTSVDRARPAGPPGGRLRGRVHPAAAHHRRVGPAAAGPRRRPRRAAVPAHHAPRAWRWPPGSSRAATSSWPGRAGSAWRRRPRPGRRAARSPSSSPRPPRCCRSIGPELGEVFARLHRSHGVTLRFGEGIAELRGDAASGPSRPARRTAPCARW